MENEFSKSEITPQSSGITIPSRDKYKASGSIHKMLITVDANIRISALLSDDEHHSKAIRLLSLAERGIVELQATTRLDNDISRDPWKSKLKAIPTLSTYRVGAPWRIGSTAIGNGDAIVSEQERHMLERQTKRSTNSNKLRLHSRVFE